MLKGIDPATIVRRRVRKVRRTEGASEAGTGCARRALGDARVGAFWAPFMRRLAAERFGGVLVVNFLGSFLKVGWL